jgi:hypothetical protein
MLVLSTLESILSHIFQLLLNLGFRLSATAANVTSPTPFASDVRILSASPGTA